MLLLKPQNKIRSITIQQQHLPNTSPHFDLNLLLTLVYIHVFLDLVALKDTEASVRVRDKVRGMMEGCLLAMTTMVMVIMMTINDNKPCTNPLLTNSFTFFPSVFQTCQGEKRDDGAPPLGRKFGDSVFLHILKQQMKGLEN